VVFPLLVTQTKTQKRTYKYKAFCIRRNANGAMAKIIEP